MEIEIFKALTEQLYSNDVSRDKPNPQNGSSFPSEIATIKNDLKWHRNVGWSIVGIFGAVLLWLLTFYIPREIDGVKDSLTKSIQIEVGPVQTELKALSDELHRFMALRIQGLITGPDTKNASPTKLDSAFRETSRLVQVAVDSQLPANPDLLIPAKIALRSRLDSGSLPQNVRQSAISAFSHLEAYQQFSKNALIGTSAVTSQAEIPSTIRRPSIIGNISFEGAGGTFLGIAPGFEGEVVVFNVRVTNLHQAITRVKWLNVTFIGSEIEYNGGPLYLANVTFKNCRFKFGSDRMSRKVLSEIEKSKGRPISIVSDFL